jgi:hypothetical protein
MCEQERKEVEILLTEIRNQSQIFREQTHPILVSLQNGAQKAQRRLQDCEYKQCMSQFYDLNPSNVNIPFTNKKLNLTLTSKQLDKFLECLSLS